MTTYSVQNFRSYKIKCKTNWYTPKSGYSIPVKNFSYTLTQYTPSVYAEISIAIDSGSLNDFKLIENLEISNRLVEVWFEEELYNVIINKKFFSGPFKFCVVDYEIHTIPMSQFDNDSQLPVSTKYIILKCVDQIFYKMTLTEKYNSFGKNKISNIIQSVVTSNGGKVKKITETDYAFTWLQTKMTDYYFIRSMLPYSKSSNGDFNYTFFMFNNEAYFAPIADGRKSPIQIKEIESKNKSSNINNESIKYLIESFGNKDNLYCSNHGYNSFDQYKSESNKKQAYSNKSKGSKQSKAPGTKYIDISIEDETLQKNYISNIRSRLNTFNKIISLSTIAVPDLLPINCIELQSIKNGEEQNNNGVYYILSVTYNYSETPTRPGPPMMNLILSTEIDITGSESPEGSAID